MHWKDQMTFPVSQSSCDTHIGSDILCACPENPHFFWTYLPGKGSTERFSFLKLSLTDLQDRWSLWQAFIKWIFTSQGFRRFGELMMIFSHMLAILSIEQFGKLSGSLLPALVADNALCHASTSSQGAQQHSWSFLLGVHLIKRLWETCWF